MVNNVNSMNTPYRGISANQANSAASIKKLASGQKINSSSDDPAGLAISESMRGQIGGISKASQNAQNGVSLIQTAEGGLSSSADILTRMKELAVQASNGTYSDDDRAALNKEFSELKNSLDQISSSTNYNGKNLLDGSMSGDNALTLQVGANPSSDQRVSVSVGDMSSDALGLANIDIGSLDGASDAIKALDTAINSVSETRGTLGASQDRLESTLTSLAVAENNITASESRIRDLDMAKEIIARTQKKIQEESSQAASVHSMNLMRQNAAALLK